MRPCFRISFLYLLLALPQHRNSPLPDKVEDGGIEKHDASVKLDSKDSVAGFGSAHKTNRTPLKREKRSDDSELVFKNDRDNLNVHSRVKKQSPFRGGNMKESREGVRNDRDEAMFEEFDGYPRSSGFYQSNAKNERLQHLENGLPRHKNKLVKENQYTEIIPSQDLLHTNRIRNLHGTGELDLDGVDNEDDQRMSPQKRFLSNSYFDYPENAAEEDLNYPVQEEYVDYGRKGREISDQYKNSIGPEVPQVYDENEYYDGDASPLLEGENYYNQEVKRDKARGVVADDGRTARDGFDQDERFTGYAPRENFRRDRGKFSSVKIRDAEGKPEFDYVWKVGDSTSDDLREIMKNSQRALQQVQVLQKKQFEESEPQNRNSLVRCEKRRYVFDGSRLKREDEDEQKNMKTGTDEGGGEYEEEEGKGHKDEEEYYEDSDLSARESENEKFPSAEQSQKYDKREIVKDANFNRAKTEANEQSEDFELTLQNAPVENAGKSKKSTYREGEKMNKSTERKGLKIWDQWGKWSPCSVTCGIGRSTRWRHCIGGGCAQGEKEAQIKKCTNPAC